MNPYDPILKEIATGMLERDYEKKPNYSYEAIINATLIFTSVLVDKIFENQDYDNMALGERTKMVVRAGKEIRKLIHTYTGLDTHKLINK